MKFTRHYAAFADGLIGGAMSGGFGGLMLGGIIIQGLLRITYSASAQWYCLFVGAAIGAVGGIVWKLRS